MHWPTITIDTSNDENEEVTRKTRYINEQTPKLTI